MAYIGKSPSTGIRNRFIYTATAGQATFSGTDDHNRTLSYTDAEFTDVFLNGVKLDKSDYTATSGTSIVLDEAAAAGDTLEVLNFDTFSVFSGEFSQDVTVGGATILSGDLTVDTNTLHVDSTNNRVGIGTTSPDAKLTLKNPSVSNDQNIITVQNAASTDSLAKLVYNQTDDSLKIINASTFSGSHMDFWTNNTERMRIDSSGNVLVGKSTPDSTTVGVEARQSGILTATRDSGTAVTFGRNTTDGAIVNFQKGSTVVGSIGTSFDLLYMASTSGAGFRLVNDDLRPATASGGNRDNALDLGHSSVRWDDVYATNGTIQTSDQNEKQQIASLTAAEITAAKAISKLFKTFKWNDKVEAKGDAARTHTGVIAQDVQQAMTDAGLDAGDYAFFISTTWWETQTEVPAVEADEENGIEAADAYTRTDTFETAEEAPEGATERTRLGIRYPELLAFIGAATEQRLADIETRLTALEAN